jgi:hypothetical protein
LPLPFWRFAKQPVFSSDKEWRYYAFGGIIVDAQVAFFGVPFKFVPVVCQVADVIR